jgi:hypothetical protein
VNDDSTASPQRSRIDCAEITQRFCSDSAAIAQRLRSDSTALRIDYAAIALCFRSGCAALSRSDYAAFPQQLQSDRETVSLKANAPRLQNDCGAILQRSKSDFASISLYVRCFCKVIGIAIAPRFRCDFIAISLRFCIDCATIKLRFRCDFAVIPLRLVRDFALSTISQRFQIDFTSIAP